MVGNFRQPALNRRRFLEGTAATAALAATGLPRPSFAAEKTVKIGFLAPLTGPVSAWGLPGLYGCRIWAERVNAAGGIKIGNDNYMVEFVEFDNEYATDKARTGAQKLIMEDEVKFVMMLGGDTWGAVQPVMNRARMLSSTLLPSDLSPDTPYLVAPCETHPIYNVTGVEWLARNHPNLSKAVICAQNDYLGQPSVATYLAAFEAEGIDVINDPLFFDPSTTDFAPIMTSLLKDNPDIICLDTCYQPYVHALSEQAMLQGFEGQIISCTADAYPQIIDKTSKEFMEGFIFQFPDFDDEALTAKQVNFKDPNKFYAEFVDRWPGEWSAVAWEYPAIMDLWKAAAEKAGSVEPMDVLAAMKEGGTAPHAFGPATWWGEEIFGINNALVGDWPVVVIQDGKARIQEFRSIPDWWDKHGDLLIKHMESLGQMYYQRT